MSYPLELSTENNSLRKVVLELRRLTYKMNIARFEGETPESADTIRALELSDIIYEAFGLDDVDTLKETQKELDK